MINSISGFFQVLLELNSCTHIYIFLTKYRRQVMGESLESLGNEIRVLLARRDINLGKIMIEGILEKCERTRKWSIV